DLNSIFDWKMRLGNQYMKVNLNNVVRGAQALFLQTEALLIKYYEMGFRNAMQFSPTEWFV
uniref:Uncharacterized protein n=1 Tax=Ditylenchus dipsaci TaxID=166011 RepID=A0A915EST3_9BILA